MSYHVPVLLKDCLEGLNIQPNGVYVDVTLGGGGHSNAILAEMENGKLIAFDQDPDAEANCPKDPRVKFLPMSFSRLEEGLESLGIEKVNGILADLGVSSHQFDSGERGFSTRFEGPLDMRMDTRQELSAAIVVNEYPPEKLVWLFRTYGELPSASRVVHAILEARKKERIRTTGELKAVVLSCAPRHKENQFFAQLFQAIRIEVNGELGALEELLEQSLRVLFPGGRMVVLAYHSLEDRMVKHFFREGKFDGEADRDVFGNRLVPWKEITKKPIMPDENEIQYNPRARSARLRIAEKI